MDLQLTGKVCIVTGGNRGIGRTIAEALAAEGARVAIAARDQATLDAAAQELTTRHGVEVLAVRCDTTSDDDVRAMVGAVVERFGGVDVLVNCAALQASTAPAPTVDRLERDAIFADLDVKVMGYLRCIREVVPHFRARGGGRVVNISGMNARITGTTPGSIRNAAVAALTKTLADELRDDHISLVVVHPWITRTEKTAEIVRARAERAGVSVEEIERRLAAGNLTGRLIDASEVASVVAFLASPRAVGINGDAVPVGGGMPGSIHY